MKKKEIVVKKRKKDLKKINNHIRTPMAMAKALKEIEESYNNRDMFLYYVSLFIIALIFGFLFHLKPVMMLIVIGTFLFFVPQLMYNHKKQYFELTRFKEVNEYMSQMAQSFTSTKNVFASLNETKKTFLPTSRMYKTIDKAIKIIVESDMNIREAEAASLDAIAEKYDCEKIRDLHAFLLKAEIRGGECTTEFSILERARQIWEKAIKKYRSKMVKARNLATIEFGMLLFVCIFMLENFPSDLSITYMTLIQIANTIMLASFIMIFVFLDNKINSSLLKNGKFMTQERADKTINYIENFDMKTERKKTLFLEIAVGIIMIASFFINMDVMILAIGILLVLGVHNIPTLKLKFYMWQLKEEVKKAFPKWLFDVMLLMQSNSVETSVLKSIEKAPPVLTKDLNRVNNTLAEKPNDADAYMSFLATYNVPGVESAMRRLYSLAVGTISDNNVMNVIINSNMELLTETEEKSIELKGDLSNLYQFLPILPIALGMFMYCIALIIVVFMQVFEMM